LMMALIPDADWTGLQTVLYVVAACVCPWIAVLLALRARRENGFATVWELASGTRVVVKPKGTVRPSIEPAAGPEGLVEGADSLGPFQVIEEMVPGEWIVAIDPVLRRRVWLLRRTSSGLSLARRDLARSGRLRWLQKVEAGQATWDAFEATQGVPFSSLVEDGKRVPWGTLRHWLHDLASELWDATGDQTLPAELSPDHVWITTGGRAVSLDRPWPGAHTPAERIPVGDIAGQQRFLNAIAACVESTSLPLHARPVLKNPLYVWIAVVVGYFHDRQWESLSRVALISALVVLGAIALIQLLELPFRSTASQSIFRLAVVNARGEPAARPHLLVRWAIVWLPLFLPISFVALLIHRADGIALISGLVLLLLWVGAAIWAIVHPHRGLHDRLAGTWVVRR
jgi:hypothetical protein